MVVRCEGGYYAIARGALYGPHEISQPYGAHLSVSEIIAVRLIRGTGTDNESPYVALHFHINFKSSQSNEGSERTSNSRLKSFANNVDSSCRAE